MLNVAGTDELQPDHPVGRYGAAWGEGMPVDRPLIGRAATLANAEQIVVTVFANAPSSGFSR